MPRKSKYANIQIYTEIYEELSRLKAALEEIAGCSLSYNKVLKMLIFIKVDWGNLLEIHELLTDEVKNND